MIFPKSKTCRWRVSHSPDVYQMIFLVIYKTFEMHFFINMGLCRPPATLLGLGWKIMLIKLK